MPVKRRAGKRRLDPTAELFAWETLFEHGYDFFNDAGLSHKESAPEARAATEEAWHRLRRRFLAERGEDALTRRPWALIEFGEPSCR